jgi:aryl-alcohol dehydrogenase-like predicted oxidoreductase
VNPSGQAYTIRPAFSRKAFLTEGNEERKSIRGNALWSLNGKFSKNNFAFGERQTEFERLAERRNEKNHSLRELPIADAVAEVAEATGKDSAQVALNWVRQKGTIPTIGAAR